ncbi:MAG: Asp-tRNA(Asn)/Glu-tRNA(Gln) amidotransferase subunit GatC [Deltaproteobacteria bacterium]|nr:Asp-tRNA(Asn)/Glu-tRNA(Gln) amidotransferase subunit GatC [Deltaproteobacteria bacterium]
MKITKDEVAYVANLARLAFGEADQEKFTTQLNDILLYMETLNEVDTSGIEPVTHAIAQKNAFRPDAVGDSLSAEEALANAPQARRGCFEVPKVIE